MEDFEALIQKQGFVEVRKNYRPFTILLSSSSSGAAQMLTGRVYRPPLQHAKFGDNRYGTSKSMLEEKTANGRVVVLDIEMEVSLAPSYRVCVVDMT